MRWATNTLLVPPREATYRLDPLGLSDTSLNYNGNDRDISLSDNSATVSVPAEPHLRPPLKPLNQDVLPSPPSPLRNISFEARQQEIKHQVFDSQPSSDNSQSMKGQSQDGPEARSATDPNDPSSQETHLSSAWSNLSQENGPPDRCMDVDGLTDPAMASNPGHATLSSVRVAGAFAAAPGGDDATDVDMNLPDNLTASIFTSDAGSMSHTGQLRRSRRVRQRNALASPYGDRPASAGISRQTAGPSYSGRPVLASDASPSPSPSPSRTGRVSRKNSERRDNADSRMMNIPSDHPISETTGPGSPSRESEPEDLGYYWDNSISHWRCRACPEKKFANKGTVTRHLKETKAHRDPNAYFVCGDCEEEFARQSALYRHQENVHRR